MVQVYLVLASVGPAALFLLLMSTTSGGEYLASSPILGAMTVAASIALSAAAAMAALRRHKLDPRLVDRIASHLRRPSPAPQGPAASEATPQPSA